MFVSDQMMTSVWEASPQEFPGARPASGRVIEADPKHPIGGFLTKYRDRAQYSILFDQWYPWITAASAARGSGGAAMVYEAESGGALVLIPDLNFDFLDRDAIRLKSPGDPFGHWPVDEQKARQFYTDLISACRLEIAEPAPTWLNEVSSRAEKDLFAKRAAVLERMRPLSQELESIDDALATEHEGKVLLYESGTRLEEACATVLALLGGERLESETGRADLRFRFPQGVAVVEVKGLTKSAKESNAAQLEKWASAEITEGADSSTIKPMLIVNHYREMPPSSRPAPFPDQMITYSVSRNQALISTAQLFAIRDLIQAGELSAPEAVVLLFATKGPLADPRL
jgi:hypothetical protein